jgi:hypothetical protein
MGCLLAVVVFVSPPLPLSVCLFTNLDLLSPPPPRRPPARKANQSITYLDASRRDDHVRELKKLVDRADAAAIVKKGLAMKVAEAARMSLPLSPFSLLPSPRVTSKKKR